MGERYRIRQHRYLSNQEGGIFSVNGMKAKLFSVGHHESLFSVLRDGKYTKNSAVTVVKHEDLENNEVYKLGSFKGSYRSHRECPSHREFPKDNI